MLKPKVSVIVPVYNVEQYVAECLDSLVNQTLHDIEIVCVDDCSTDGSVKVIRKYMRRDKRIKLIRKDKNTGQSDSRNIGVSESSAPYIMFCDSDDWFAPNMCEKMLSAIGKSKADLAVCSINVVYEANAELKTSDDEYYVVKYSGVVQTTDDVVSNTDVSPCNKIFKRKILDTYDVRFPSGLKYEDAYFFNAYVLWASRIFFITDKLYNYRRHANSTMAQTFDRTASFAIDHLKVAIQYCEYLKSHGLYKRKYEYFWKNIFVPFFQFVIYYSDNYDIAFALVRDFINENYIFGTTDTLTDRRLRFIANGAFSRCKKHLGGLVRVREHCDRKRVDVFWIPLWGVKYQQGCDKYYILGIQYRIVRK